MAELINVINIALAIFVVCC